MGFLRAHPGQQLPNSCLILGGVSRHDRLKICLPLGVQGGAISVSIPDARANDLERKPAPGLRQAAFAREPPEKGPETAPFVAPNAVSRFSAANVVRNCVWTAAPKGIFRTEACLIEPRSKKFCNLRRNKSASWWRPTPTSFPSTQSRESGITAGNYGRIGRADFSRE